MEAKARVIYAPHRDFWYRPSTIAVWQGSRGYHQQVEQIRVHLKCGNCIVRSCCVQCRDGRVQICDLRVQSVHHSFDAIALCR